MENHWEEFASPDILDRHQKSKNNSDISNEEPVANTDMLIEES